MALEVTSNARNGIQKAAAVQTDAIEVKQTAKAVEAATSAAQVHVAVQTMTKSDNQSGKGGQDTSSKNNESDTIRLKSAVKRANDSLKATRTRCEFSYHEETNRISIKVYDKETEEVIREIPSEEALELIQKMYEMAGMLVDEKR